MGAGSMNWDLIYDIAREQRTLPLVSQNIRSIIPDLIPSPVAEKLKSFSFQNTTRSLFAFNFLWNIVRLLKSNGISVLPFKGLLTAQDIYGDISLRSFSDLDLLVERKQALKAWKLLEENGFTPELPLEASQIKKYIHVEDNISFQPGERNLTVELHWEMTGYYLPRPLFFEDVAKRAGTLVIYNKNFINLSSEDQLLYLCVHGAKHGWEYMEQICCVAEIVRQKKLDWHLIEALCADWKCTNMLYTGINLANMLCNAPVPDQMYEKIRSRKVISAISEAVLGNMFKTCGVRFHGKQPGRFSFFHLRIRDTSLDRLHYIFRLAFRPTKQEWRYFPLPAWLSFLHFILRPYRLITSLWGQACVIVVIGG
jgi:hypothetical protein